MGETVKKKGEKKRGTDQVPGCLQTKPSTCPQKETIWKKSSLRVLAEGNAWRMRDFTFKNREQGACHEQLWQRERGRRRAAPRHFELRRKKETEEICGPVVAPIKSRKRASGDESWIFVGAHLHQWHIKRQSNLMKRTFCTDKKIDELRVDLTLNQQQGPRHKWGLFKMSLF